jgi:hypothetical protein
MRTLAKFNTPAYRLFNGILRAFLSKFKTKDADKDADPKASLALGSG